MFTCVLVLRRAVDVSLALYIYIYIYIGYTYKSKVTSSCLFIGIACRSFPEVATWLYHKIVKTGILWRMIGIFSVICVGYT